MVKKIPGKPGKKGKKSKCKCFIEGTDTPTDCPEDGNEDGKPDKFVVTNIGGCKPSPPNNPPPDNPPPPPPRARSRSCARSSALQITNAGRRRSSIKNGDTRRLRARCLDNGKSDGDDQVAALCSPIQKSGSGPASRSKFDKDGEYVISAKANTKTCKGSDSRIVEVLKKCVDVGIVRICGDSIIDPGSDRPTCASRCAGNVRMGLKGSGTPPRTSDAATTETPDAGDQFLCR